MIFTLTQDVSAVGSVPVTQCKGKGGRDGSWVTRQVYPSQTLTRVSGLE